MKKHRIVFQVILISGIVLMFALFFRFLGVRDPGVAGGTPGKPQPTVTALQGYPVAQLLPANSGYPGPQTLSPTSSGATSVGPTPVVVLRGETPFIPTETAWPTAPYPPTPTRRPGPSPTAIAPPTPAKDASGSIQYALRDNQNNLLAIQSLGVDAKGQLTSHQSSLTPAKTLPDVNAYPAPNGRHVVIADQMWGGLSIFHADNSKVEPLFRGELSGLTGIVLGWHPDNTHVLIAGKTNYSSLGLLLVDALSGEYTTLMAQFPSPSIESGAISFDGQRVAFSSQKDLSSGGELWTINLDGSEPRQILFAPIVTDAIAWSPDGTKLAFTGGGVITVVNNDGSGKKTFHQEGAQLYSHGRAWSPDGRYIVLTAWDTAVENPTPLTGNKQIDVFNGFGIYVADTNTGEVRRLMADGNTENLDPTWSPDGLQIAFASLRNGKSEIWAVNVDGTNLRQLTKDGQFARFPYWH